MKSKFDAVRERIAKLLNLTEERGASEAEAQTALALAQRMMREHDIAEADVLALGDAAVEDEEMAWFEEFDVPQGGAAFAVKTWVGVLGYRVGLNQGCAVKWARGPGSVPMLRFYGRRSDCDAASYLLRLAMAEVERLTKAWTREQAGRSRQAKAYRSGVASAITSTLRQEWVNARAKYAGNASALVVLDRGLMAQRASACHGKTTASRRASAGYLAGRRDGAGVSLNGSRGSIGSGALRLGPGKG